jgi:microcystin degradation protein MlrC
MRILVGECKQETSSFNPRLTEYEDFAVEFGEEILAITGGCETR